MELKRSLDWERVKGDWKRRENIPDWQDHWESKGFDSWEEWRRNRWMRFSLKSADWSEYELQPVEVSALYCSMIPSWMAFAESREHSQFRDLVKNPDLQKNDRVLMFEESPADIVELIVVFNSEIGMVIDGHHSSVMISKKLMQGDEFEGKVIAHGAQFSDQEFERMFNDKNYKIGRALIDGPTLIKNKIKRELGL